MRQGAAEFARFVTLGGVAAAANWLARFPLSNVLPYLAAVAVAYVVGMVVAFVLFSRFVFPDRSQPLRTQVGWFVVVNLAGIAQVVAVAWLLRQHLFPALGWTGPLPDAAAHAVAIAVPAVSSYFGHKWLTFRT